MPSVEDMYSYILAREKHPARIKTPGQKGKVHASDRSPMRRTACGKRLPGTVSKPDTIEVTCKSCLRALGGDNN